MIKKISLIMKTALFFCTISCLARECVLPDLGDENKSKILEQFDRSLKSPSFVNDVIKKRVDRNTIEIFCVLPVMNLRIKEFVFSNANSHEIMNYLKFNNYYMAQINSKDVGVFIMDLKIENGKFKYVGGNSSPDWIVSMSNFKKKRFSTDTKHAFILNAFPVMKLVRITTDDKVEIYSMNPPGLDSSNSIEGLKEYLKVFFPFSDDR